MQKADSAVWHWLHSLLSNDETLVEGIHAMIELREQEVQPKRERYEHINKRLA